MDLFLDDVLDIEIDEAFDTDLFTDEAVELRGL